MSRLPASALPRLAAALLLACLACTSGQKTSTGRTERETDSVIGQSRVPGAHVVKRAMDSQDSARAQAAGVDTAAADE
jgi:hypothetical protein